MIMPLYSYDIPLKVLSVLSICHALKMISTIKNTKTRILILLCIYIYVCYACLYLINITKCVRSIKVMKHIHYNVGIVFVVYFYILKQTLSSCQASNINKQHRRYTNGTQ